MKKYILLIGAYERDNLGDVLFAKVYQKLFSPYNVVLAGLVGRDLRVLGVDRVVAIGRFFKNVTDLPLAIIHCGGETLSLSKESGVSMNLPTKVVQSVYYPSSLGEIADTLVTSSSPFAYIYNHEDLGIEGKKNEVPIVFNSVGGSTLIDYSTDSVFLGEIYERLENASYISVRDDTTAGYLEAFFGIKPRIYPDIVSLLPITSAKEIRNSEKSTSVTKIIRGKPYIFVQINNSTLEKHGYDVFVKELTKIFKAYKCSFVFQPFGLAGGHGSFEKLEKLRELLQQTNQKINITVHKDRNIWNQVVVVKNAYCAIGTSLHLRILCSVFERPCVSLNNHKVNCYAATWKIDKNPFAIVPPSIARGVKKALKITTSERRASSKELLKKACLGAKQLAKVLRLSLNLGALPRKSEGYQAIDFFKVAADEAEMLRSELAEEIVRKNELLSELNRIKSTRVWQFVEILMPLYKFYKRLIKQE